MFTITFVIIALILTDIVIVVSEICLSIENHDLTDQLNEQICINKYLAGQITTLHSRLNRGALMKPADTIIPPQE